MKMTSRLFVRSGGGLPGLDIHAGIWQALSEAGIFSTHNAGCSAGAIISALDSDGYTAEAAGKILRELDDKDVRAERFAWKVRAPWIDWFLDSAPIRKLLKRLLTDWELLQKPLEVVATRVGDGACVRFRGEEVRGSEVRDQSDPSDSPGRSASAQPGRSDLISAVLASMSISGVFPWVRIGGDDYCDGGVRANLPLPANWRDCDEVWLLIATRPLRYSKRASGILSRLLLNADLYALDQVLDVLERIGVSECRSVGVSDAETPILRNADTPCPRVRVIWPELYPSGGALRFDHQLIEDAHEQTKKILTAENAEIAKGSNEEQRTKNSLITSQP